MKLRVLVVAALGLYRRDHLHSPIVRPEKQKFSPPSRKFRFTYSFTVKDIPPGTKVVRVWVPVAHTDEHQTVRLVNVNAPVETEMTQEPEYGNRDDVRRNPQPHAGNCRVHPGV